jgi:uncharacterized membrane protein
VNEAYLIWKTAHIVSAAVLFGTGLGITFFAWFGYRRAMKTDAIEGLKTVLHLTILADLCFTTPAVIFQAVSGLVLMHLDGVPLLAPWSVTVFVLYTAVGACWLPVVWVQVAMEREARAADAIGDLSLRFHRRFTLWFVLGVPAFLLVLWLYYLMVSRSAPFTVG